MGPTNLIAGNYGRVEKHIPFLHLTPGDYVPAIKNKDTRKLTADQIRALIPQRPNCEFFIDVLRKPFNQDLLNPEVLHYYVPT